MKDLKNSFPKVWLIAVITVLLASSGCDTPKKVVHQLPDVKPDKLIVHDESNPSYIVTDSVHLAVEEFSAVDNLAKGIKTRGAPNCVFLNVKGLKLEGGVNVSFDVFLNKTDADPQTGIESPHYVDTVSIGHPENSDTSFDLKISLDKTIENLGETLVEDITSGKLYITMVAFPYSGNLDDLKVVSFSVEGFSLNVICD
ncbi:MAG: hypothetical protein DHS20C18_11060 [Saprospiraceae bacterium]|nr:MAG: hypothetical protein DHS20C18_11060 [Saprospiraceae bacterium]